jgi:hypothetical protein
MRFLTSSVAVSYRVLACIALGACGGDKPATEAAPTGPIVGVLELPISLRSRGAAPSDFHDLEISPTDVHLGGQPLLTLAPGAWIAPGDRQATLVPKLAAALSKTPHARLALTVASAIPYETVALLLATAKSAGVRSVSFKVRAPGSTSATGWISLDALDVRPKSKSDDEVAIAGVSKKPWSDFTSHWDDAQNACKASPTGSCAFKPTKVADGGDLKIVLHAAGQGVNVDFYRIGEPPVAEPAPAPEKPEGKHGKHAKHAGKQGKKHKPELIDGVQAPKDVADEAENAPPATEASFQFRAQEAVATPSAVSETLKPVCGAATCGVVIQADKSTLFVRVMSLLGAAFPDGTTAPFVVFELP